MHSVKEQEPTEPQQLSESKVISAIERINKNKELEYGLFEYGLMPMHYRSHPRIANAALKICGLCLAFAPQSIRKDKMMV